MFVYKITNRLNGKIYVGQTRQAIEKRFLQHSKANSPLGDAMRQCGLENFTIEVVEECLTAAQADEREKFWIKVLKCKFPNGYNQTDGGAGTTGYISTRKRHEEPPRLSRPLKVFKMTVAESLKRFRREFNLNQKQVAETLGIKQQSYQVYESKTVPSAMVVLRLADAYDVSADYLLGLSDEPRPVPADKAMIEKIASCRDSIQELLSMVDKATASVTTQ